MTHPVGVRGIMLINDAWYVMVSRSIDVQHLWLMMERGGYSGSITRTAFPEGKNVLQNKEMHL